MKLLLDHGYKLVLATNQSYLGTDRNPESNFDTVMDYFYKKLSEEGIEFDYLMICPHGPEDQCSCRKPQIGGLDSFLNEHQSNIDIANSVMFGDRDTDRMFADNLGVKFVEVKTNEKFVIPAELLKT